MSCWRSGCTARSRCWRRRRGCSRRPSTPRDPRWGAAREPEPATTRSPPASWRAWSGAGRRGGRRRRPALLVGKMQSQKLATIAAAGLVAIAALPAAIAAHCGPAPAAPDGAGPPPPAHARRDGRPADHARRSPPCSRSSRRCRAPTGACSISGRCTRSAVARRARRSATGCSGSGRAAGRGAARAPAAAARLGAVVRAGGRDVRLPDHRRAPAGGLARVRRRTDGSLGPAPAAGRRAARHRSRRRRLLRALRRRRLRRHARRRLPGRRGRPRQRHRRELRGRRRARRPQPTPQPAPRAAAAPIAARRAARRRLQGQPTHHHDRRPARRSAGRRRLRPPGRAVADADAGRAGRARARISGAPGRRRPTPRSHSR